MPSFEASRYTTTAIALHWLLALALLGSLAVGVTMTELPLSPLRLKLTTWHQWAGITIMVLSFVRLAWRLSHRPPADLPMPAWQRKVATGTHRMLYALFFLWLGFTGPGRVSLDHWLYTRWRRPAEA